MLVPQRSSTLGASSGMPEYRVLYACSAPMFLLIAKGVTALWCRLATRERRVHLPARDARGTVYVVKFRRNLSE